MIKNTITNCITLSMCLALLFFDSCSLTHKNTPLVGKFTPSEGKTLLFIGQDLGSVREYIHDTVLPLPFGTTTYVNFFSINRITESSYGGLCVNGSMEPDGADANWGAGPLNAYKNITEFPDQALSIGLYMVESSGHSLADVARGKYDANIDKLASFISFANRPVFVRIGYECDGIWNGYDPVSYKNAYRHIVQRIRDTTVNGNAGEYFVSVWQVAASPSNDLSRKNHVDPMTWYPGDDVVDWLAFSYFVPQWEPPKGSWSQHDLADEIVSIARKKKKPVMIAEATPQGYDIKNLTRKTVGHIDGEPGTFITQFSKDKTGSLTLWNEWYKPFFSYIKKNNDAIRAVAYINANWDSQRMWGSPYFNGYWGDSRIQANEYIKKWWIREITADHWMKLSDQR